MTTCVPAEIVHAELVGAGEPTAGTSATDPASTAACEQAEAAAERETAAEEALREPVAR